MKMESKLFWTLFLTIQRKEMNRGHSLVLKDLTIRIDVDAKEILLDKKRFSEVSVDEN